MIRHPAEIPKIRFSQRHGTAGSRRRSGYTLVELMVVIAMLAVFMMIAIVLLGLLLRADAVGHDSLAAQLTTSRLSRQFRDDAHSAIAVSGAESHDSVTFAGTLEERIVWSAQAGRLTRTRYRSDTVTARESYRLHDSARFLIRDGGRLVELRAEQPLSTVVETSSVNVRPAQRETVIQAVVGLAGKALPVRPAAIP
jgi:prepilin-type N-terminal cleavage/methylation domain-containing protein